MQYRKNSSFLVVSTSVYSVQTVDKSDATDKLALRLTLVELATSLLQFFFFPKSASAHSSHYSIRISLASFLSWMLLLELSRLPSFRLTQTVKASSARDEGEVLFGAARFTLNISICFSILKCPIASTMPPHIYLFILSLFFPLSES